MLILAYLAWDQLKENGWKIVRISVDKDTQLERLKATYDNWEVHWENRNNPSEAEVDLIPYELVDWFVDATLVHDFADELAHSINDGFYEIEP